MADFFAGYTVAAADLNGDRDVPLCHLVQAAAQTGWTSATETAITFGTGSTIVDTLAIHSESSNNTRLVIGGKLGWWKVKGTYALPNNSAITHSRAIIYKNGSAVTGSFGGNPTNSSGAVFTTCHTAEVAIQATSASDYVEIRGYETAASGTIGTAVNSYVASSIIAEWSRDS